MKKIYLIAGASSDIGMEYIAHLLNNEKEEYQIIAHFRRENERLRSLIEESEGKIIPMQADFAAHKEVLGMIAQIKEKEIYPTHILFLPAPNFSYTRYDEYSYEKMLEMMDVQVFSLQEILSAFLPVMAHQSYGKVIVMISSCVLGEPPKSLANYVCCKYALLGAVKAAAAEYGQFGVNVNGVSPDMVETKFIKGIGRKMRELTAESNPKHRNLLPSDLIGSFDFLFSEASDFMNGYNLNLSGKVY